MGRKMMKKLRLKVKMMKALKIKIKDVGRTIRNAKSQ